MSGRISANIYKFFHPGSSCAAPAIGGCSHPWPPALRLSVLIWIPVWLPFSRHGQLRFPVLALRCERGYPLCSVPGISSRGSFCIGQHLACPTNMQRMCPSAKSSHETSWTALINKFSFMFLAEASVPPHNIREGAAAIFPTFQLFPKIFYCTVIGMPTSDKIINGLFHFIISNRKIALKLTFHMIMDIL